VDEKVTSVIELEEKVAELQERVACLEWSVWRLPEKQPLSPLPPDHVLDKHALINLLKKAQIIRDPLPEEKSLAGEWHRLPKDEKLAHIQFMQSLTLDPPLSQIIVENRR